LPQYDINLREYWRILRKRKLLVIFTTIVLGAFSVVFAALKAPTPIYTSSCGIKFERETTLEGLYAQALTWSGGDDIETQISLIKSYTVFEKVAENLGLIPKTSPSPENVRKPQIVSLIGSLQSKVEVTRESNTNILDIQAKDTDPAFAQRLANNVALTYKDLHSENQMKRTTEAIKYIEDQLTHVRQKLRESEEDFNKFSQDNHILSVDLQSEKLLARNQEIKNELRDIAETRDEFHRLLVSLEQFIKSPKGSDYNFFSAKAYPQYQAANDALVGLMLKRDSLLQEYTWHHPEVIDTDRKVVEHARKMKMLLEQQLKEMDNKEQDLRTELAELDKKSADFMDKKLEFDRLKRKVELYHDMTTLLERKNQEAQISKAERPEEVSIIKPALLATSPINPPRTATTGVMGLLIGLVVGLLAAFVVETFDTSLGAIEEVERILQTNVLGVIPYGDSKELDEILKERLPEEKIESISPLAADLIAHFSPTSLIAESFRGLRTNIQSRDQEQKNRTIVVASASPEEGKTFVSMNLAITMAQTGLRTLLVGSDMRKPSLAKAFGIENNPGLSEILLGNYVWRDTVKTIADIIVGKMSLEEVILTPGLDNLHMITSGSVPPNPAELIQSKLLKEFIEEAKAEYDFIIFDTPPILSTADSAILGSRVDGVLLVYRLGSVSRGLLKRSITQLEQANCEILGVVLNGMKPEVSPDFQDYKYYRYYHSSGEEEKRPGRPRFRPRLFGGEGWKEAEVAPGAILEKGLKDKGSPSKPFAWAKYPLVSAAVALLVGGILWHTGIINPRDGAGPGKIEKRSTRIHAVRRTVPKAEQIGSAAASPKLPPPKNTKAGGNAQQVKVEAKVSQPPSRLAMPVTPPPAAKPSNSEVALASGKTLTEPRPASHPPETSMQSASQDKKGTPRPKPLTPKIAPLPYSLYLGSLATRDQAERAIANYSRKGFSPYWAEVDLDKKGIWFRIYLGHFKRAEDAERFAAEHALKEAEVKKTEYANLIGVYAENNELERERKRLSQMGHMPYMIKELDGKCRLLVGAFITEAGAERLQRELKTNGVDNQIVRR
jgi:succinoglycan biosynthesis transport protein ExoP